VPDIRSNIASPKKCWISGVSFISSDVDKTVVPVFLVAARFGTASATAVVLRGQQPLGASRL